MADEAKKAEEKQEKPQPKEEAVEKKDSPKVTPTKEQEEFVSKIESMSVIELSGLVKVLEDKFGVSAQAPMMMAAAGAPAGGAAAAEEEKSTFSVVLADIGANKIQVIKEIRALTNLGLKEAKELVESAPKEVKTDLPKEEAEKIKKQLDTSGAKVELK